MAPANYASIKRLEFTVKFIEGIKPTDKEVRYTDAKTPGLTLAVKPATERKKEGSKLWRFRYMLNGKAQMLSLGAFPAVSLKDAREKAHEIRKQIDGGANPSEERKVEKQAASELTFQAIADAWLADRTAHKWEETHAARNKARFSNYIYPVMGNKDINDVTLLDFDRACRDMIKNGALVVAHRTMGMCVSVLSYAARFRYLKDKNIIFDWKEFKVEDLPKAERKKLAAITEPAKVGELLHKIGNAAETLQGKRNASVLAAVRIAPYLMARPGEVVGAQWEEINLEKAEWYIKADRMKAKRDHVVPLSRQAVELLMELKEMTGGGQYVFPSPVGAHIHISETSLLAVVKEIAGDTGAMTSHGFKAMGSTLLNGNKNHEIKGFTLPRYDKDLIEIQLAHIEKNKVRDSYNRRDSYSRIQERRDMMQTYADLLDHLREQYAGFLRIAPREAALHRVCKGRKLAEAVSSRLPPLRLR